MGGTLNNANRLHDILKEVYETGWHTYTVDTNTNISKKKTF